MARYIIANWKSHKNVSEAQHWMQSFVTGLTPLIQNGLRQSQTLVIFTPPFPLLSTVQTAIPDELRSLIKLGVQSLSPFPAGSYTGAVSARTVEGLDVEFAILGHSETRRYFHVSSQEVAQQAEQAAASNITPVVCIDTPYLAEQAQALDRELLSKVMVAYEPVSAIGTGNEYPASAVAEVVSRIHTVFGHVPVLYGGSVDAGNVNEFLQVTNGALVGTHSLEVDNFLRLVEAAVLSE